jgi:radical S-adenosyl methionine domain-containing protein 2
MQCKFCYASFEDINAPKLGLLKSIEVINLLANSKHFKKINFAGGEPTLVSYLPELVIHAKSLGLQTSIITNGSLITDAYLKKFNNCLDLVGVSIDSIDFDTNIKAGRALKKGLPLSESDYKSICNVIKNNKLLLKINTVVNQTNIDENISEFINEVKPKVEGQNDAGFDSMEISNFQYENYLHSQLANIDEKGIVVPENSETIKGSYIMLDPNACLYESNDSKHNYSTASILEIGVEQAMLQMNADYEKFVKRGGDYKM